MVNSLIVDKNYEESLSNKAIRYGIKYDEIFK